jgi:VWFA-related protein
MPSGKRDARPFACRAFRHRAVRADRVAIGLVLAALVGRVAIAVAEQRAAAPTRFFEIAVVALDDNERPLHGLRSDEFSIKEDGRPADIVSLTDVGPATSPDQPDNRSLVLMLDDVGMKPTATQVVQFIARRFLSRLTVYGHNEPTINVIRLSHTDDEPLGNRDEALRRIDAYQSGSYPLLEDATESWLKVFRRIVTRFEPRDRRRVVLVAIGQPRRLDVAMSPPQEADLRWPYWVDAISAAARADAALYLVDPAGLNGSVDPGIGLVEETGGAVFTRSNTFDRAVDQIWQEISQYYLIRYASSVNSRPLHSIDVSVARHGVHVRARRSRGE